MGGGGGEIEQVVGATNFNYFKFGSKYGKNVQREIEFDATFKCKDRLDFYPYVADAPLNMSDPTCHKFYSGNVLPDFRTNPLMHTLVIVNRVLGIHLKSDDTTTESDNGVRNHWTIHKGVLWLQMASHY